MNDTPGPIDLAEYRALVRGLPRPTDIQIESFTRHVAQDHAWYTDIPLVPPGVPFHFYLDNGAGFDCISDGNGEYQYSENTEYRNEQGTYGIGIPTETYLQRFGYLNYFQSTRNLETRSPWVLDHYGRMRYLDDSIMAAGQAELTSVIHYRWDEVLSWNMVDMFLPIPLDISRWPMESGGPDLLRSILEIVEENNQRYKRWIMSYAREGEKPFDCVDDFRRVQSRAERDSTRGSLERYQERVTAYREKLRSKLRPERERQFTLMRAAILRVLELVYE